MEELIQINSFPVKNVLRSLLQDKTTGKNIIFATDNYSEYGCADTDQITINALLGFDTFDLQPRVLKARSEQSERTRKKAEVFTPTWICNFMNNHCDEVWFGQADVFNKQNGEIWKPRKRKIPFKTPEDWQAYILSRRLEITCGESPFLVTRYDATTGEPLPVPKRVGVLDRKLRVVNENTADEAEWWEWAVKAYESTYGYEFQGDNLLIARINLLITFCDNLEYRWQRQATEQEITHIANIIAWNIWQMDGLKEIVPVGIPREELTQLSFFEEEKKPEISVICRLRNWRSHIAVLFSDMKKRENAMKFDFVIGNPPYQDVTDSDSTRMPPIYHFFMDAAYALSDSVMLITPARFLFNAGYTPKDWNEKMLNDEHFKVVHYEPTSSTVFPNTDIKGGVVITYRDSRRDYGAIGIFTKYTELNGILNKVRAAASTYMDTIIHSPLSFQLSALMKSEHPELTDRLRSSAFATLGTILYESAPNDGRDYISMLGLLNGKRTIRYIRRDYITDSSGTLDKYTLLMPKASGSGNFGEVTGPTVIAEPGLAHTQTFISIGAFDSAEPVENIKKYVKTKFLRCMLSVLKITQDCPAPKWKYIPLQDFTSASDINWNCELSLIDRQLYNKYGLTQGEIRFIENNVQGME